MEVEPGPGLGLDTCNDPSSIPLSEFDVAPGKIVHQGKLAKVSSDDHESMILNGKLNKVPCKALPDTGATDTVIDAAFIDKAGLTDQVREAPIPLQLSIAGDTEVTLTKVIAVPLQVGDMRSHIVAYVMPSLMQNVDVILGMNWLRPNNAIIDTANNIITVTVNNKEYKLLGETSETIGLAALQRCSGQPLITAKQAVRA